LPRSGALLDAQASLTALPDELLGSILRRAWADRPPRPAAEEVRRAADLSSVCRRVRALLRAQPLPLALDFSAAPLSTAQGHWLLKPVQAGRIEAANFAEGEDALWNQQELAVFLARHSGTLLQLSSVPLRLVASEDYEELERPALDLSCLRLTKLGIDCNYITDLVYSDDTSVDRDDDAGPATFPVWLWPECLPGALEELELFGLFNDYLEFLMWAPESEAGLAGRLPRLHTLRMTCGGDDVLHLDHVALLNGFPVLRALAVDGCDEVTVHADLFGRVRYGRVEAGADGNSTVEVWGGAPDLAVALFMDRLCSAGLQAAELCAAEVFIRNRPSREVVREMISGCGDRFAVEVGTAEDPCEGPGAESPGGDPRDKAWLLRLAWRCWPAPGAPDLPAARAAHERARAWAAE
jgi:hypothetical protein